MTPEEELLLLKKQLHDTQLKLHEYETKKEKPKTPEEIIRDSRMHGDPPHDQFAHQNRLLWHPKFEPKSQMDLLPEDALLGTIKDSKTLMLFQNDNVLLNRFYDIGERSKGVRLLFDSLFYGWWQGLRLTGALGGQERWFQSFETPFAMSGESFSFLEKHAMKKKAKQQGLRSRLMGAMNQSGEEKMYE
jgi:hypothetical protein